MKDENVIETTAKPVLARFQECVKGLLDSEGVYPHVLVFEKSDGTTQIEFIDLREPICVLTHCLDRLIAERPKYLVFGMDRFSLPDQGVNTKDFVSVYFWDDDGWRFGILEYDNEKTVGLRWDCDFWKKRQEGEIKLGLQRLLKVAA
jgi:hypothetical protein